MSVILRGFHTGQVFCGPNLSVIVPSVNPTSSRTHTKNKTQLLLLCTVRHLTFSVSHNASASTHQHQLFSHSRKSRSCPSTIKLTSIVVHFLFHVTNFKWPIFHANPTLFKTKLPVWTHLRHPTSFSYKQKASGTLFNKVQQGGKF